jgi:hypothetical protein
VGSAGWVTAQLATPLLVTVGQQIRVVYDSVTSYWHGNPQPSAAPSLEFGAPYMSCWGTPGAYPSNSDATSYWVDVVFQAGSGGDVWPIAMQGGVSAYRHVQATAATVWNITHGLAFRPNVSAVDSTGREMWPGAVDYPSATTVQLTFSAAVGGEAYLS